MTYEAHGDLSSESEPESNKSSSNSPSSSKKNSESSPDSHAGIRHPAQDLGYVVGDDISSRSMSPIEPAGPRKKTSPEIYETRSRSPQEPPISSRGVASHEPDILSPPRLGSPTPTDAVENDKNKTVFPSSSEVINSTSSKVTDSVTNKSKISKKKKSRKTSSKTVNKFPTTRWELACVALAAARKSTNRLKEKASYHKLSKGTGENFNNSIATGSQSLPLGAGGVGSAIGPKTPQMEQIYMCHYFSALSVVLLKSDGSSSESGLDDDVTGTESSKENYNKARGFNSESLLRQAHSVCSDGVNGNNLLLTDPHTEKKITTVLSESQVGSSAVEVLVTPGSVSSATSRNPTKEKLRKAFSQILSVSLPHYGVVLGNDEAEDLFSSLQEIRERYNSSKQNVESQSILNEKQCCASFTHALLDEITPYESPIRYSDENTVKITVAKSKPDQVCIDLIPDKSSTNTKLSPPHSAGLSHLSSPRTPSRTVLRDEQRSGANSPVMSSSHEKSSQVGPEATTRAIVAQSSLPEPQQPPSLLSDEENFQRSESDVNNNNLFPIHRTQSQPNSNSTTIAAVNPPPAALISARSVREAREFLGLGRVFLQPGGASRTGQLVAWIAKEVHERLLQVWLQRGERELENQELRRRKDWEVQLGLGQSVGTSGENGGMFRNAGGTPVVGGSLERFLEDYLEKGTVWIEVRWGKRANVEEEESENELWNADILVEFTPGS